MAEKTDQFPRRRYCGARCRHLAVRVIRDGPYRLAKRIHATLWETRYASARSGGFTSRIFGTASGETKAREQLEEMRDAWAELQADFETVEV